jgi:hypothetical protein
MSPSNPQREAYFGDTHVHTSWSADCFMAGTRVGPEDAYRFARGEAIDHVSGEKVQLRSGPLDFLSVTEHSEYLGVFPLLMDPNNPLFTHRLATAMRSPDPAVQHQALIDFANGVLNGIPIPELVDEQLQVDVWKQIQDVAERYNEPGKFTTFIGYEWSCNPEGNNLHRNVIFRGSKAPERPFSTFDSLLVEDLWTYMENARKEGIQLLAIPHNSNMSDGLMFQVVDSHGHAIDRTYAQRRIDNEPLVEIIQLKGESETHPALSPTDEFSNFAISDFKFAGQFGTSRSQPKGSYVRDALRMGLVLEESTGVNPYKFGVVGSSDTHNAGAAYEEDRYFGKIGREDGTPEVRLEGRSPMTPMIQSWGSAGLAGVWAEENTREAIFDAMARKETFGTSGPRIRVRFFGGWNYARDALASQDWLQTAYEQGVAMGGDLSEAPQGKAPTFLVWAVKDANSGNLDRIQIVKGWSKSGQSFEKVHDVVWSGDRAPNPATGKLSPVGNTVDLGSATYSNSIGATALSTVWTDPDFDPTLRSFYYARVIEIPTPRWSTYDAVRLGIPLPANMPPTIQERAYTSAIWYAPSGQDLARTRQASITVEGLEAQGLTPLTDDEIRALIVGKSMRIRNLMTGEEATAFYSEDGKRTLTAEAGFAVFHGGATAATNPYEIRDGRLHSSLDDGSRFSSLLFKVGNRCLGAMDLEAGYLNWEVSPA